MTQGAVDSVTAARVAARIFLVALLVGAITGLATWLFIVASHYRSPINYSEDSLLGAQAALERFYAALRDFGDVPALPAAALAGSAWHPRFTAAMDEDFNTPEALAVLFDLARELNTAARTDPARARSLAAELKGFGAIFGILQEDPLRFRRGGEEAEGDAEIDARVAERTAAKKARDFARADAIRAELLARGIVLEDTREGTVWRRA